MRTEFRPALLPKELRSLQAFDRKVFRPGDWFPAAYWRECESYWLLVEGRKIGCCAFEKHEEQETLYISSTGILPAFQRQGFGQLLKVWQIAYARRLGFQKIVTNVRERNQAMIVLNRKFDFRIVRTLPRYYSRPTDAAVVMELLLH